MKSWYQNRMATGVNHRGYGIPEGKKVYLTEAQVKLHNSKQEKVAKCDPPKDQKEVGVLGDWNESLKAKPNSDYPQPETTDNKRKSSTKAKS